MAAHQQHQRPAKIHRQQRHGNRRDNTPHDQRVPLPLPDIAKQPQGVVAQMFQLAPAERQLMRVKELDAHLNKRKKQKQMQRRRRMNTHLRRNLV